MKKQQRTQIILVLIGLFLIFSTYFYYPYMNKHKQLKSQSVLEKSEETVEAYNSSNFENVEYNGIYDFNNPFVVKSEKAYIMNDEPDVLYMTNMHAILYLTDGRIVNIISDQGTYNKVTYDCYFEKNVKATDGDTVISAENLDLLATKNSVEIYNSVKLNYPTGSLAADKVNYDFETKYFRVSMFDDNETIKMRVAE